MYSLLRHGPTSCSKRPVSVQMLTGSIHVVKLPTLLVVLGVILGELSHIYDMHVHVITALVTVAHVQLVSQIIRQAHLFQLVREDDVGVEEPKLVRGGQLAQVNT